MKVVIFGAGRVGRGLLRILEKQRHTVIVVEENKDVCEEIAVESNATVINGDATTPELLDEIKIEGMDHVFAVTGNEETNFLASVYSKQAGAKNVISRVSEAKHSLRLQRLGVETVISEFTLARDLANRVSSPTIFKLLNPIESNVELAEKKVDGGMAGKMVADVNRQQKYNIVAIFHEGKFHVPGADAMLQEGMKIIIIREK
ncbi:MAG: TrkA family potassium uptake protein [Candidatus ainarchaeum sp.]|nr:TrkA family potassium uptake protein [Candidatus ainarchaeum sp.]